MNQGLLAGIFLRQNSDQRYLLRAFPRGLEFAANAGAPQEVGLPVLRKLLKAESEKEAQAAQARTRSAAPPKHSAAPFSCTTTQPPSPNSGVPIGYSSTIGPKLDALCFNYTVENPPAPITQITFDSSSNASSFSSILNTSDSISGGFTALKANDNFTYSQNYQSSVNSGQVIFSAESIYTLNVILDPNNPLNPFGCQEFKDHLLGQICGDQFMSQIAAGAIIMGEFSWWSNSSTASTNVSNTLTGGDGTLVNISSAISSAQSVSDSFTKFHFEIVILGGGPTASNDLQLAVGANADSLSGCIAQPSNQSDCNTYITNMNKATAQALEDFNNYAQPSSGSGALPMDLSYFQAFPNGVSGTTAGTATTQPLPSNLDANDAFGPYQTQINDYASLSNEIATLSNRVQSISLLVGTSFNPLTSLPLQNYLSVLNTIYSSDLNTMLANWNTCSGGTGSVGTNCAPIINNTLNGTPITNAYQWYSPGAPNPNKWNSTQLWSAQQNSIALQYNATNAFQYPQTDYFQTPMQVLYIGQLPSFNSPLTSLSGAAALVTFADLPFPFADGNVDRYPFVVITPISNTDGSPTDLSGVFNAASFSNMGMILNNNICGVGDSDCIPTGVAFTTPSCEPTITDPCPFEYGQQVTTPIGPILFFENYLPISGFYTPLP